MGKGLMNRAPRGLRRRPAAASVESLESRTLCAKTPAAGLDLSFGGGDGFVELPLAHNAALSGAATAPDGKIVVCGYTKPVDGPSVGPGGTGVVTTDFDSSSSSSPSNDEAFSVLVQADGKVVVAGLSPGFYGSV